MPSMRRRWVVLGAALAVIICISVVIGRALFSSEAPSGVTADQVVSELPPEVANLGPGSTLHTVFREYVRYDPAQASDVASQRGLPDTVYVESWLTFDGSGKLSDVLTESRDAGGVVYQRTRSDGTDLVYEDGSGTEQRRLPNMIETSTVEQFKRAIADELASVANRVSSTPGARHGTLDGQPVTILESRSPVDSPANESAGTEGPLGGTGYSVPYVSDLNAVETVTRSYLATDSNVEVRHEVAAVDSNGNETVIESTDQVLAEVLPR